MTLFLGELAVKNLRRHEDLRIELKPLTVLLGANNVGKSALMDGLQLLSTASRYAPFRFSLNPKFTFDALSRLGGDGTIAFDTNFADEAEAWEASYSVRLGRDAATGYLDLQEESLTLDGVPQIVRPGWTGKIYPQLRPHVTDAMTSLGAIFKQRLSVDPKISRIGRMLGQIGQYRMTPHNVAEPGDASRERGSVPSVQSRGSGVTDLLGYLSDHEPSALKLIEEDLKEAVDDFESFEFQPAGSANEEQFVARFKGWTHPIEAPQLSDGTLSLIGLVTVLRSPRQFHILCLEEPENGLTPKAISALVRTMSLGAPTPDGRQPQLIVSTHSPFLVSSILDKYALDHSREEMNILVIQHDHLSGRTEARPFEPFAYEAGFDPTYEPTPDAIAKIMSHLYA